MGIEISDYTEESIETCECPDCGDDAVLAQHKGVYECHCGKVIPRDESDTEFDYIEAFWNPDRF